MAFRVPEKFRVRTGLMASTEANGNNGLFQVRLPANQVLRVVASDQMGWEHVSVSRADRCPTWEEMCQIKALFWSDDECVMQLHPPREDWISNHKNCLHLWKPLDAAIPRPPAIMVGIQALGELK